MHREVDVVTYNRQHRELTGGNERILPKQERALCTYEIVDHKRQINLANRVIKALAS
jgi:hypothetical protein